METEYEKPLVLVVDDDPTNLRILVSKLNREYRLGVAKSGTKALEYMGKQIPDLVLLDVMMPDMDGYAVCEHIKRDPRLCDIPVVFISYVDDPSQKTRGFEVGGVDYITKPFNPRELTIRARNLLSRTMNLGTVSEERRSVDSYKFNGWELDINSRSLISPNGEQYKLPRSEFRAMLHFCENPGKIQSRAELLKKMTGRELKPHDRTVDVTIRRIRKHFESTPDTPEIIATIHGEGYRFCGDLQE